MSFNSLSFSARRPLNRWDHDSIRPGPVGSVGDVNLQVRYKHSAPDMPLRFDPNFSHQNEIFLGSNVQDGQYRSYDSGGGPSAVLDSNWEHRGFKTSHGWYYQDLRAPDTLHEPETGEIPHYTYNNLVATAYEAFRTGNQFLPVPGGYAQHPGEVTRGGQVPRIVGDERREAESLLTSTSVVQAEGGLSVPPGISGRAYVGPKDSLAGDYDHYAQFRLR